MAASIPLPPNISSQAVAVWQQVTESLTSGDITTLTNAIKDFIALSATDKATIEDIASTLPYPGLPAQLITEIFANPEVTIGVISRLGSEPTGDALANQLGTSEQAIVLNELITWLKSEQNLADQVQQAAKLGTQTNNSANKQTNQTTNKTAATSSVGTNPLNLALQNYLATGALSAGTLNMSSLQFLKNSAISLAGLQIADPALLGKAYEKASEQLFINLLPDINTSNSITPTSEQGVSTIIQHQLVDSIRKAMQDGAIPLNMQTFLVLWSAITIPAVQGPVTAATNTATNMASTIQSANNVNLDAALASGVTSNATANTTTNTATTSITNPLAAGVASGTLDINSTQGITSATGILPASPIVASILASLPSLFVGQNMQTSPALIDQLGMLSFIYTQMAPYWSGPAAVSLMTAKGGEVTDQAKTQSAVRAFAIALGTLLNDPTFDQMLGALITNKLPNISQEQLKSFISAMKISILMNALVALNIVMLRKMQGQFRADELAQLILGPTLEEQSDIDDLQSGLIKTIQVELLNIPEEKRASFIYNLLSAYSADTDVNALIDPTTQFLNLCDPTLNIDKASNTAG